VGSRKGRVIPSRESKMKKVIGFLSLLAVLLLILFFLGSNLTSGLPFPTKGDQVKVEITRPPDIPENMKIVNHSKIKVGVYAYNDDDPIRWIERHKWVLNPGQSASCPLDNYRFKVVIPGAVGIFERVLVPDSGVMGSGEVEITGDGKNIKILGQVKKKVTLTNKTNENIRIIAYKPEDQIHAVGFIGWYLAPDQKIEWDNAPRVFTIRVFRPQTVDKILATASNVRDQSDIVIRPRGIWDWIKSIFS
jgi:hypothetical protein